MPRNKSEKHLSAEKPKLPGFADWVMDPVRQDALYGHKLNEGFGPGDRVYDAWSQDMQRVYDNVPEHLLEICYNDWVAYYKARPAVRAFLTGQDDIPF